MCTVNSRHQVNSRIRKTLVVLNQSCYVSQTRHRVSDTVLYSHSELEKR
ncbi:hypothetical protein HMPREF1531_00830 [Propionibacterium sp. oral taxon 192 str. F0372]|nr:hypothetical protein HMPREF1531_00830 [Propionibacterium sp. oral taxon 192 str. F0372]